MSAKHSLLGQSLVRSANALNYIEGDQQKHWSREWYTPSRPLTSVSTPITPTPTPTPFGDEATPTESQQKYRFKVKTWVQVEDYKPVIDGDEDDVLDLNQFSTIKNKDSSNNDLSDDAIRGAVASGGDAIPGISKSTDEAADSKVEGEVGESGVQTPVEQTSVEQTPVEQDTDVIVEPVEKTVTETTGEPTELASAVIEPAVDTIQQLEQPEPTREIIEPIIQSTSEATNEETAQPNEHIPESVTESVTVSATETIQANEAPVESNPASEETAQNEPAPVEDTAAEKDSDGDVIVE